MEDKNSLGERSVTVPMHQWRKLNKALEEYSDDTPIRLELVLTALFPTVFDNIMKYGNDCYMQGYLDGKKEQADEDQGTDGRMLH